MESTGILWMLPTLYEGVNLGSVELLAQPELEQRSPLGADAPK
jgi:hypothetical protein